MGDTVRIAVVGGGRAGAPLIQEFLNRPYAELVGVADIDPESAGARIARDNGVFFTTDALELAAMGEGIDLLIEVSGDPTLKRRLKSAYVESGNLHTIIIHDLVARLVWTVISGADTLAPPVHPDDVGVG